MTPSRDLRDPAVRDAVFPELVETLRALLAALADGDEDALLKLLPDVALDAIRPGVRAAAVLTFAELGAEDCRVVHDQLLANADQVIEAIGMGEPPVMAVLVVATPAGAVWFAVYDERGAWRLMPQRPKLSARADRAIRAAFRKPHMEQYSVRVRDGRIEPTQPPED